MARSKSTAQAATNAGGRRLPNEILSMKPTGQAATVDGVDLNNLESMAAAADHFGVPLWVMFVPGLEKEMLEGEKLKGFVAYVQAYLGQCFHDIHNKPIPGTPAPAPCPFCGGRDCSVATWDVGKGVMYYVNCNVCGAEGAPCETMQEAAEAWNRRAA